MKTIEFIFSLVAQTIFGFFAVNILFFVATIKAAINGYPNHAEVKIDIKYGEKILGMRKYGA